MKKKLVTTLVTISRSCEPNSFAVFFCMVVPGTGKSYSLSCPTPLNPRLHSWTYISLMYNKQYYNIAFQKFTAINPFLGGGD